MGVGFYTPRGRSATGAASPTFFGECSSLGRFKGYLLLSLGESYDTQEHENLENMQNFKNMLICVVIFYFIPTHQDGKLFD